MPNPENEWQPIETAPENTWVEVFGDSGMHLPEYFLTLAIWNKDYSTTGQWLDVQRFPLSDNGWTPLYWRHASPVPPMRSKVA